MLALNRFEQLQPVEFRALQPYVEEDQLWTARFNRRDGLVRIARQARAVPLVLQDAGDEPTDVVLVIDDKNVSSHQGEPILSFFTRRRILFGAVQRQSHQDFGAPAAIETRGSVKKLDPAAMVLEYLDDNRQAEPRSLGSRGDIGLDQTMPILARKAFAVVADSDLDEVRARPRTPWL